MKFLVRVLTTNERSGWVHPVLCEYLANLPFMYDGSTMVQTRMLHNHIPAAAARNYLGRQMRDLPKEDRPDWVVMIDNDMGVPLNLLETVVDAPEDAAVVVPIMHMWDEAKMTTIVCWGMGDNMTQAVLADKKYHSLTKCGTGVIFIRPEVFDKIDLPYFWYPKNELEGIEGTEDIAFCTKVLESGMKIYGNSSVLCSHFHNVNLAVLANAFSKINAEKQLAESRLEAVASPA